MSLIINGTTIPVASAIKYDGTQLSNIIYNGTKVWMLQRDPVKFGYTGGIQAYTIPTTGLYKLEVWGAAGGDGYDPNIGYYAAAAGGYSKYHTHLQKDQVLYIVIGGAGSMAATSGATTGGGYNGGGYANNHPVGRPGSGGGATHIATRSGTLAALGSTSGLLIVAGGGGGAGNGGPGGSGGGLTGNSTGTSNGGTQSSGGISVSWGYATNGSFGQGGVTDVPIGAGGGGGLYGGGAGAGDSGGSGGSGYIPYSTTVYNGTTYTNTTVTGQNSGHGRASILLVE